MCVRVEREHVADEAVDDLSLGDALVDRAVGGRLHAAGRQARPALRRKVRDDDVQALALAGRALEEQAGRQRLARAMPGCVLGVDEAWRQRSAGSEAGQCRSDEPMREQPEHANAPGFSANVVSPVASSRMKYCASSLRPRGE